MPPSSDSQTPIPFQWSPTSPLYSLFPLTRLSVQDPFVEPMFTYGGRWDGKVLVHSARSQMSPNCFPCTLRTSSFYIIGK